MSPQRFTSNVPHSVLCLMYFFTSWSKQTCFLYLLLLVHVFLSYLSSLFYHSLLIISLILYNWFCWILLFTPSILFAILTLFAVAFRFRLFKVFHLRISAFVVWILRFLFWLKEGLDIIVSCFIKMIFLRFKKHRYKMLSCFVSALLGVV